MNFRNYLPGTKLVVALCLWAAPCFAWAQISDDFSGSDSVSAVWQFVDPAGDADWAAYNGWLTLSVPSGAGHDLREGINRTSRLLQDFPDGDFEIEAKFQSLPAEDFQVQGLVAETDQATFLHLDVRRTGHALQLACATVTGGVTKIQGEIDYSSGAGPVWLRLAREGDAWRGYHSPDGETWSEVFHFTHAMKVVRAGVFGGNSGSGGDEDSDLERDDPVVDKSGGRQPAPAFQVQVDYFFDTASPIVPEDGDVQNGVRVTDGLLALYYFREGSGDLVLDYAPVFPKLDLAIADTTNMAWLPEGGVDLTGATLMASLGPAEKIIAACRNSDEITVEAWLHPATVVQSGPARIVTVSADPSLRNVSLAHGQWGVLPTDVYDVRLRTTTTSDNGQPETVSPEGTLTGALEHVVFTYDGTGTSRIFVDGVETVAESIGGVLDNWDDTYRLAIGAEMDGTRHWLGKVHLAAVYDRALTAEDIDFNHRAGPQGGALANQAPVITLSGITPGQEFDFLDPLPVTAVAGDANDNLARVDFFAGDVLLFSDATAPYEYIWVGPAVGTHQIRAVAVDDEGSETDSGIIPILVTVPPSFRSALFISDDFSDSAFNTPWTVADGTAGATFTQADGHLAIDLPAVSQDPWAPGAQEVFAHQSENDVDIALELKLAAADFTGDAYGGLRFEGAGGEVVQVLGERSGGAWTVGWGSSSGGVFGNLGSLVVPGVSDALWLQVRRESGAWSIFHSEDGLAWNPVTGLTRAMVLTRCGWVVGGLDDTAGSQTVVLDYAFDLATPIFPEDGGEGGDLTGPVIGSIDLFTDLEVTVLSWETDEPAFYRLDYGTTAAHELGTLQGQTYMSSHSVEITGLAEGTQHHFKVTCVDTVGNISTTEDLQFHTDAQGVVSQGPGAGDVYREESRAIYLGNDWRVTDPDALNPGAAAFLPNPVLDVEVPDLTGAVRAEMIIDRWGGHPGTSKKRIRLNGKSWLHLPELSSIPSTKPECFMYQDNLMIDIPLDQLQTGTVTLEGTSGDQICNSFNWGQWGWYGLVLRVYYEDTVPHPTGNILSPAAGDTIIDSASISINASSAGTVQEVHVLGWYEGLDGDGDGVFTQWQREHHRNRSSSVMSIEGIVAKLTAAPWESTWDVEWIPDQQPGSVKMQARILDDTGMWYVTEFVEDLSLRHSDGVVKMYTVENVPYSFWVRSTASKSVDFTIPAEDDLSTATGARMTTATWNGADEGVVDINGQWQATNFGAHHFYSWDTFALPTSALLQGVNIVTITAPTPDHGMEMLWPGPMFMVRYGAGAITAESRPGNGDLDADGRTDQVDALMVLDHLVGAVPLETRQAAAGDLSGDGRLDPWDAALIIGADPDKAAHVGGSAAWGEVEGRYGQLALPLELTGTPASSLWLEVTAPGMEEMVRDVTSDLDELGLFRWKASGDKLSIAFATSSPTAWPDRVLEIVLDVSNGDPGDITGAVLAVDGGEPVQLSDSGLTGVPVRFSLGDNFPNPFNPSTKISFDLPVSGRVRLKIYDIRGQVVRTLVSGAMPFGTHTLEWSGADDRGRAVPSGVYFYRLEAEGFEATRKMMLLK